MKIKIDILPARLEVTRNEDNVVQSAVLKIGGQFASPFKYVAWNVALDDLAHLEPIERNHGEWKKDGFFAVCSNCEHELQHYDLVVSQIHFCPNCGAKMRTEE